ncbi:MAG: gliding motility-associated C-terminal domain-containing protein [Saprospiraceae bacterium]|nr:gliding motility-associated C-terminal domain-containing protein [Saprospiraceae bacterium]
MVRHLAWLWMAFVAGLCPSHLAAQMVIDSFERDLGNWQILEGFAEIYAANEYSGMSSVRLHRRIAPIGSQTTLLHRTFQGDFGVYDMACFAEGDKSDIQFLFQYIDDQNYYGVASNPRATDNPQLILWKVINGNYTVLDSIGPVMDLNKWYKLRIERYCTGEISVYVGDSFGDTLRMEVNDRSILVPGTIGLAAWGESIYFDDVSYEKKNADIATHLKETICSGTFFQVGNSRYSQPGIFLDTLLTSEGCDSIVELELDIALHYLLTDTATVCANEGYFTGTDTLRTSGRYNLSLMSKYGCDSLVDLTLIVVGEHIEKDTFLCGDQFLIFNGDTITEGGSYLDTLMAQDGCFSTLQLNVHKDNQAPILGPDQTICFSMTPAIPLSAEGFDSIRWNDGRTKETIAITAPGIYSVEAYNGNCILKDTIEFFEFCEVQPGVFIPNAFSPNNDQINDFFQPQFPTPPQDYSLKVFNRWGDLVYSSFVLDPGWDGRVNGTTEPTGVYVYLILADGAQYAGTITLLR